MSIILRILILLIAVSLLISCTGSMLAISSDQTESLSIDFEDGMGTRDVIALSSNGERFLGTLIWIKDAGSSGRYKGALVGSDGRTLDVKLECNTFTTKCVGTGVTKEGKLFFIR